ncbi:hypothetical protein VAE308_1270111 [Vibrio aestuarianus]|nr:hypothetical protein VAE308_1270111 [Vibrio aestuarianus]
MSNETKFMLSYQLYALILDDIDLLTNLTQWFLKSYSTISLSHSLNILEVKS